MITTDTSKRTIRRLLSTTVTSLGLMAAANTAAQAGCYAPTSTTGEICLTATTYCPAGTVEAAGQLLVIADYPVLFALLKTTYGGDGRLDFALPDLRGRVPVGSGTATGLAPVLLGEARGANTTDNGTPTTVNKDKSATTAVATPSTLNVTDPQLGMLYCIVITGQFPDRPTP